MPITSFKFTFLGTLKNPFSCTCWCEKEGGHRLAPSQGTPETVSPPRTLFLLFSAHFPPTAFHQQIPKERGVYLIPYWCQILLVPEWLMGKHHDWREDALSISAVWAPSLSCSLFPKSLWGSALIAGFLFVPEFCISCSLLYQQHRFTKTWLILNWAKLNMELSRTLNKPQTHHPRPQEMTFLPKATGFIAFYSKPLWNPRSVIHGRWQLQGVMEPGEKA